jgi:hypothetical protein
MGSLLSRSVTDAEAVPLPTPQDSLEDARDQGLDSITVGVQVDDEPHALVRTTSTTRVLRRAPKRWRGSKVVRVFEIRASDADKDPSEGQKERMKRLLQRTEEGERQLDEYMHALAEEEEQQQQQRLQDDEPVDGRRRKRVRTAAPVAEQAAE